MLYTPDLWRQHLLYWRTGSGVGRHCTVAVADFLLGVDVQNRVMFFDLDVKMIEPQDWLGKRWVHNGGAFPCWFDVYDGDSKVGYLWVRELKKRPDLSVEEMVRIAREAVMDILVPGLTGAREMAEAWR